MVHVCRSNRHIDGANGIRCHAVAMASTTIISVKYDSKAENGFLH